MARRKSRKGRKNKGNSIPMLIMAGVAVVAVLVAFFALRSSGGDAEARVTDFRIGEYREKGGSTFIGNHYTLAGKVENIVSVGNSRLVSVSLKDNRNERLPLLVPGDVRANLSRGDSFLFDVECRNGKDAEGLPVKGVFLVTKVSIM